MKKSRYHAMVYQFEAFIVTEELKKFRGHVGDTAASLGIHRNALSRTISKLRIDVEGIKNGNHRTGVAENSGAAGDEKKDKISEISESKH